MNVSSQAVPIGKMTRHKSANVNPATVKKALDLNMVNEQLKEASDLSEFNESLNHHD